MTYKSVEISYPVLGWFLGWTNYVTLRCFEPPTSYPFTVCLVTEVAAIVISIATVLLIDRAQRKRATYEAAVNETTYRAHALIQKGGES